MILSVMLIVRSMAILFMARRSYTICPPLLPFDFKLGIRLPTTSQIKKIDSNRYWLDVPTKGKGEKGGEVGQRGGEGGERARG